MMKVKIFIVNDKGGVGKSTLAQLTVLRARHDYGDVRVAEYDRQPKLRRFFGPDKVISIPIAPDWETQLTHPDQWTECWDPMIEWLEDERPLIVDFGAQSWAYFAAWAASTMLSDLVDTSPIVVLVPVTADLEAITSARHLVTTIPNLLPGARLILLTCDKDGEIALLKNVPEYVALLASARKATAAVVELPVLGRDGYAALAGRGLCFDQIARARPSDIVDLTGLSLAAAARAISNVQNWLRATQPLISCLIGSATAGVQSAQVTDAALTTVEMKAASTPLPSAPVDAGSPPLSPSFPAINHRSAPVRATDPEPEARPSTPIPINGSAGEISPGDFDEQRYLMLYPDVYRAVSAGVFASGYDHYVLHGRSEGRKARRRNNAAP